MGRKPMRTAAMSAEDAEAKAIELYEKQESGKVRKRPDSTANVKPDENRQYIELGKQLLMLEPTDMNNAAQVKRRLFEYMEICEYAGQKPSIAGLALAFGIDRRRLSEMHSRKRYIPPDSLEWIDRAYSFVNMQLECWMQDNKIQAVAGIFLSKANFGYEDTTRLEISAGCDEIETPEQIAEKYADIIKLHCSDEPPALPDFDSIPTDL